MGLPTGSVGPERFQVELPSTATNRRSMMTHRPGTRALWTIRLQTADPSASYPTSEAWPIGVLQGRGNHLPIGMAPGPG
jgi:hypothetical protein